MFGLCVLGTMSESHDKLSLVEIERFKLEVSRQQLQYLGLIRTRGFHVDDAEIGRLDSELTQEEQASMSC